MQFHKTPITIAAAAALVSVSYTFIEAAAFLRSLRRQADALPVVVTGQLNALRADVRTTVKEVVAPVSANVAGELAATRTDLVAQAAGLRADANSRLNDATVRIDAQLTRTNDTIAQIGAAAVPLRSAAAKIDSALPFYTDCDAGMCLANVIYGIAKSSEQTLRSVDRTMQTIAATTPPVAASVQKTASAVEKRSRQSILRNLFRGIKNP